MSAGNRVLWIAIGAVLTAAGLLGALASRGVFGAVFAHRTVLGPAVDRRWHAWHGWSFVVVIAVGVVLAVLGFLLLRAQLRGRGGAPMADLVFATRRPAPAPEERD